MKEKILEALKEPLEEIGVSIYDITLGEEDGVTTLFIKIDSSSEVDTNLCAKSAEIINPIIDNLNLSELDAEYVLDVCSKGVTENE